MIRNSLIFMLSMVALAAAPAAQAQVDLDNASGFRYDIDSYYGYLDDGRHVPTGRSDACDGCWELYIDGSSFGFGSYVFALDDRELRIGPQSMSGLEVSRRVFVPADANFVRYLEILHNPTGSPITVDVTVDTNLGSDGNTTVRASSDGNLVVDTADDWVVSSDANPDSGDPVVLSVWQGLGGTRRVDEVHLVNGDDDLVWSWNGVEVPAGGTVIFMHVGAMNLSVADAVNAAEGFYGGSGLGADLFARGMTDDEIDAVVNWCADFADEDGDGLPDCWESAYGFNPAINNAAGDPDGDGLTNLAEFQAGTDPTNPDTDGDGLSDGDEINVYGTNPRNPDTDGDGIPDGTEVSIGLDPNENQFLSSDKVMVTSGESVRQSDVAVDAEGQVHVTWIARIPEGGPEGGDSTQKVGESTQSHSDAYVWYRLFDADGVPLMDAEMVSYMEGRAPSIAVDSTGQAYIAWDGSGDYGYGAWLGVPGLPINGATETGAQSVQEITEPVLLSESGQHVRIAVDGDGNIHAVWRESAEPPQIHYAKVSGEGEFLVQPTLLVEEADWNLSLNMALDSDGNVHIVWTAAEYYYGQAAVYYLMADGSDGSVIIDRTRITPALEQVPMAAGDGEQRHSDLVVDASGRVHIVWSEQQGNFGPATNIEGGNAEVYYAQLDPSLRSEDGPVADVEDLLTVAPKLLTTDNGLSSYNSTLSIDADDNLMLLWTGDVEEDFDEDRAQAQGESAQQVGSCCRNGPLMVQRFDMSGNAVTPVLTLYATDDTNSIVEYPYPRGSAGWATWVEGTSAAFIQNTAATEAPAAPNGQATVTSSAGTVVIAETVPVTVLPAAAQASAPSGFAFPDGLVRVVVSNLTPGDSITITITFPSAIPDNAVYYKWNTNDGWIPFSFTRTGNPNQVVLTLVDGGAGDGDGIANGFISDPGGFAVPTAPPAVVVTSRGSGGGGGCAMTTGGRTFDPLLPLLLLLALAGLLRRRSLQGGLN